ncbi:MAG: galactonate dehydratase [Candidatus Poribacteria bacterium]|nr:galactonate dehydratase [Candidatus Poribacteria bacterium]
MKISHINTYLVGGGGRNYIFVKVVTDDGLEGIGEAYSCGPDDATVAVIHDFEEWIVGDDPRNIDYLWQKMYNFTRFPGGSVVNAAISGIEQALWDISARELGVPVWRLLGGKVRDKVRIYHSVGNPEGAFQLQEELGLTAFKTSPFAGGSDRTSINTHPRIAAERLKALRDALGEEVDIGVDPHAKIFEPIRAIQMAEALKPYNPFFFEEPLRPENIDAMAHVRSKVSVPIATGEMIYTKFGFRDLLVKGAADILQPDICVAGGLGEQKRIAAMAEAFYTNIAPHNPMGPVATAVNVHFAASTQNFLILEYIRDDRGPRRDWVKEPMPVVDGYIPVPETPGYGIELNEEAFGNYPAKRWRRGFSYRVDGTVAYL